MSNVTAAKLTSVSSSIATNTCRVKRVTSITTIWAKLVSDICGFETSLRPIKVLGDQALSHHKPRIKRFIQLYTHDSTITQITEAADKLSF